MSSRTWPAVVALFGAFALTYNLAVVVHELGHLLVSWILRSDGPTTWEILFHPFSVSYVWQDDWADLADATRAWILTGGMATGIAVGALAVPVARLSAPGSTMRLAAWMFVANSMMLNGMYLVTALLVPWGDVGTLLQLGAPVWIVASVGCVAVTGWLLADVEAVRTTGLEVGRSSRAAVALSVAGATAYPLLIVGWQIGFESDPLVPLAVYVIYAAAVAIWMAGAVPIARRRARANSHEAPDGMSPRAALVLVVAGTLLVVVELVLGAFRISAG